MKTHSMKKSAGVGMALLSVAAAALGQAVTVYRCPGPSGGVEYTNGLTPQQAKDRNCRTIEGAPITIVAPPKPRPVAGTPPNGSASRASDAKVDAGEQRSRDSDARKILEVELRREEAKLAEMQKEFNNGQPERLGSERNYQKYLDRVKRLKDNVTLHERNIEALKKELSGLN